MLRSRAILVIAILAAVPLTKSTAEPPAAPTAPKTVDVCVTQAPAVAPAMPVVDSVRWSPRLQASLQLSAVDHAYRQVLSAKSFEPDSFPGAMLDSLLNYVTPEGIRSVIRDLRPEPTRYRRLLAAIEDRRNRGSTG